MKNEVLSMKKILITGGTGFVGANFVHRFLELKDDVHLLVRPESTFSRIERVRDRVRLHCVDITKEDDVEKFVLELKPDIILHFAAYGGHRGEELDTRMTIDTNVLSTINLMNACSKTDFTCFINTGSSSEYGEKTTPMKETDVPEPNNVYGVTKAAATMYGRFLAEQSGLPLVTMRLFSPYGYFEGRHRLMPTLIRAALYGEKFEAPSPKIVRDFVFIEDVIGAYLMAIGKIDSVKGNTFNIASGEEHSIAECVSIVEKISGKKVQASYGKVLPRQKEPEKWIADITKAQSQLGWKPVYSLAQGLSKLVQWTKESDLASI